MYLIYRYNKKNYFANKFFKVNNDKKEIKINDKNLISLDK